MTTILQPFQAPDINPDREDYDPPVDQARRIVLDHAHTLQLEAADRADQAIYDERERRTRAARDNIRREREEAELSGELSGEARAFHDLRLAPLLADARTYTPKIRVPVVQGLLNQNALCWVAGKSGTFKSFVTADLAFRYGSGDMSYYGRKMTHGRALIIVAEGEDGYAHRRIAWEAEHGREVENVVFYPGALQLGDIDRDMPALLHHLRQEDAAGRPYGLIIVDTQAMCTVGVDENSSEMNLVINVMHRIRQVNGACVLVVHHFGKDKSAGMRGSSMQYAAADTIIVLKRDPDSLQVTLSTAQEDGGKQKDLPTERDLLALEMRFHVTGKDYFDDDVTSLVAAEVTPSSDVRAEPEAVARELPWVTEQQMEHLKLIGFYENKGATPGDMAARHEEKHGPVKNARQNIRNRMIELSKTTPPLVEQYVPKGPWYITPAGVAVIARQVATGENWVERAARRRAPRGGEIDGQEQVSGQVSAGSRNLASET